MHNPARRNKHLPRSLRDAHRELKARGLCLPPEPIAAMLRFILNGRRSDRRGQPNAMVIVGPPGSGKSFALEKAAFIAGVQLFRFSIAECESSLAGKPTEQLRRVAQQLQRYEDSGKQGLLVTEDCECGMADPRPGEGSSTNRPQLQGVIQELLDGTHAIDGRVLTPKQMMFTSNKLKDMRKSMIRESRCLVIEYDPNRGDRAKIAAHTLRTVLPPHVIRTQIRRLAKLSVAEIVSVRTELRQQVEQLMTFDLSWRAYESWIGSENSKVLTEAVAERVLGRRDLRRAVNIVRGRARLRRTSFL